MPEEPCGWTRHLKRAAQPGWIGWDSCKTFGRPDGHKDRGRVPGERVFVLTVDKGPIHGSPTDEALHEFGQHSKNRRWVMRKHQLAIDSILTLAAVTILTALPEVALAKRTVYGYVKEQGTGKPVAGLLVEAWDNDPDVAGSKTDDFMGAGYTNAQGYYEIHYADRNWDYNIPVVKDTGWRPDIYIKVKAKTATGDWVKAFKSAVQTNQRLRDDLRIDATVPPNQWISRRTQFNPWWHGWPFPNDARKICAAPTCDKEHWLWGPLRAITTFRWGLCGGMSLTALRRFREGVPVKEYSPDLKDNIAKAQLETLDTLTNVGKLTVVLPPPLDLAAATTMGKFIEWQAKPTQPHTFAPHTIGYSTEGEWPKVHKAIDAGAPIILGLIREQSNNPLAASNNHQVLAIGYDWNELTKDARIYVYDPNYPKFVSTLIMNFGLPENQIKARQIPHPSYAEPPLRGFFVIPDESGPPKGPVVQPTPEQQAEFQNAFKTPGMMNVAWVQGTGFGAITTRGVGTETSAVVSPVLGPVCLIPEDCISSSGETSGPIPEPEETEPVVPTSEKSAPSSSEQK